MREKDDQIYRWELHKNYVEGKEASNLLGSLGVLVTNRVDALTYLVGVMGMIDIATIEKVAIVLRDRYLQKRQGVSSFADILEKVDREYDDIGLSHIGINYAEYQLFSSLSQRKYMPYLIVYRAYKNSHVHDAIPLLADFYHAMAQGRIAISEDGSYFTVPQNSHNWLEKVQKGFVNCRAFLDAHGVLITFSQAKTRTKIYFVKRDG